MVTIVLTADPSPKFIEPSFVKKAYAGLKIISAHVAYREQCPDCHLVPMQDVIQAMATHDWRAYQYMRGDWEEQLHMAEMNGGDVWFPIPFCCSEIITAVH